MLGQIYEYVYVYAQGKHMHAMHIYLHFLFCSPFQPIPLFPSDSFRNVVQNGGVVASVALTATPFASSFAFLEFCLCAYVQLGKSQERRVAYWD